MRFKISFAIIFSFLMNFNLSAHEGGHGNLVKTWLVNNEPTLAEFVKYEQGKVFLLNAEHQVSAHELSLFTAKDQDWILKKHKELVRINQFAAGSAPIPSKNQQNSLWYLLGGFSVLFSLIFYSLKRRTFHLTYGLLGGAMITFAACNTEEANLPDVPANDASFMSSLFGNFTSVSTSTDAEWFYIASNGLPKHDMMVGITNWQQQVPIDQNYTGSNSWAVPLQPELSSNPLSTETNLLKGAIAIAVNGIPIFNPLNNRGEDANVIGELDQWGGHCGRADDYHYHLPPTHLQSTVGAGNPIAYAVDGFPVYGETTDELDEYLGKFNADGSYQYHTVPYYPYFIAGMRGKVELDPNSSAPENQVIPQAMTQELRPATSPLQGAEITNFVTHSSSSYSLTYTLNNEQYVINYSWDANNLYTYEFVNPNGTSTVETYQR